MVISLQASKQAMNGQSKLSVIQVKLERMSVRNASDEMIKRFKRKQNKEKTDILKIMQF